MLERFIIKNASLRRQVEIPQSKESALQLLLAIQECPSCVLSSEIFSRAKVKQSMHIPRDSGYKQTIVIMTRGMDGHLLFCKCLPE